MTRRELMLTATYYAGLAFVVAGAETFESMPILFGGLLSLSAYVAAKRALPEEFRQIRFWAEHLVRKVECRIELSDDEERQFAFLKRAGIIVEKNPNSPAGAYTPEYWITPMLSWHNRPPST